MLLYTTIENSLIHFNKNTKTVFGNYDLKNEIEPNLQSIKIEYTKSIIAFFCEICEKMKK
jgi:hypothetical protein